MLAMTSLALPAQTRSVSRRICATLLLALVAACGGGGEGGVDGDSGQISPIITAQPSDVTAVAGNSARLSVSATGSLPLEYQWSASADGVAFTAIPGATDAAYDTGTTTLARSGTYYRVLVTNSVGRITSNAGRLTVIAL